MIAGNGERKKDKGRQRDGRGVGTWKTGGRRKTRTGERGKRERGGTGKVGKGEMGKKRMCERWTGGKRARATGERGNEAGGTRKQRTEDLRAPNMRPVGFDPTGI